ncbi:MAG: hypothetical protein PV358_06935 [Acidimicrobiales bacterium]|nr:hypothetical protein [Acidimicrobiales bacterium]
MSERDQRRQLAVGAGTSPADPGGRPVASPADGDIAVDVDVDVDVVQAVAALVSDLVEAVDERVCDPAGGIGGATPEPVGAAQQDLVEGPDGTHGDAVAPRSDRGGTAVGPTAR